MTDLFYGSDYVKGAVAYLACLMLLSSCYGATPSNQDLPQNIEQRTLRLLEGSDPSKASQKFRLDSLKKLNSNIEKHVSFRLMEVLWQSTLKEGRHAYGIASGDYREILHGLVKFYSQHNRPKQAQQLLEEDFQALTGRPRNAGVADERLTAKVAECAGEDLLDISGLMLKSGDPALSVVKIARDAVLIREQSPSKKDLIRFYRFLADAYIRTENFREAAKQPKRILAIGHSYEELMAAGMILLRSWEPSRAELVLNRALAASRTIKGGEAQYATALIWIARAQAAQLKYDQALDTLRLLIAYWDDQRLPPDPLIVSAYHESAVLYLREHKYAQYKEFVKQCELYGEKIPPSGQAEVANTILEYAQQKFLTSEERHAAYKNAIRLARRARAISCCVHALVLYSVFLEQQNRLNAARELRKKALSLINANISNPPVINLAGAFMDAGQFDIAEVLIKSGLKNAVYDEYNKWDILIRLANCSIFQGHIKEGEAQANLAIDYCNKHLQDLPPIQQFRGYHALGTLLWILGKPGSRSYHEKADSIREQYNVMTRERRLVNMICFLRINYLHEQNRVFEPSLEVATEALDAMELELGDNNLYSAWMAEVIASHMSIVGMTEGANELYKRASDIRRGAYKKLGLQPPKDIPE